MKKNNDSQYFEDWTTQKLKREAKAYDQLINQVQCYGSSDLRMFSGICNELEARGVEMHIEISFN